MLRTKRAHLFNTFVPKNNMIVFNRFSFQQKVKLIATSLLLLMMWGCQSKDPDIEKGEAIVNASCKACHASGINGAPILGNRKMWEKRKQQDLDTLVSHAANGFGLMPAKGGNESLTEEQLRQAIKYMLFRLEEE